MISTKKRLLSMLLAITMIVSMFPHVSFAAGNDSNEPPKEGVVTEVKQDEKEDTAKPDEKKDEAEKGSEEGKKDDPQAEPAKNVDAKAGEEKKDPPAEGQGNRDGETNYTPQQIHDMIKDYADSHYIVGTTSYTPKIELSIVEAPASGVAVEAGTTLEYMLKYHYLAPDKWEEGWSSLEFMADYYGKSNTGAILKNQLVIKLPAGLLLKEAGGVADIQPAFPDL